jgi:glycosyltransferase involved in cell wall biosynthesis
MHLGLVIYGSIDTLSGGYLYDRRLVASLRARGDRVEILSLPWRNYAAALGDNLRFRLPPGLDLLVEDELNHPSLLAANRRPHPCPVVSLVHHLRSSERRPAWQNSFYRRIERGYLRSVDAFIFNSETTRAAVRALAGEQRPGLVAYPPTDRFAAGLDAGAVGARALEPGPLRLLFLGNLIPRKGLHTLLEALARLPEGCSSLDAVGSQAADPAYAASIRRRIETPGLAGRVRLHGTLADDALAEQMRRAQLLVVPSSYEGFGIVYLEGMGFGLPAVATHSGAAAEIVTDGVDGCLVPAEDPAALAERLSALAGDRPRLRELSLAALRRYTLQPPWERTVDSLRTFLRGLTA